MSGSARWLTPEQEQRLRAALLAGMTRDQAAAAVGLTRQFVDTRLRDQLRDVRVGRGRREKRREPTVDPTPEQIRIRAAMLRRSWSEDRWGIRPPDARDEAGRYGG